MPVNWDVHITVAESLRNNTAIFGDSQIVAVASRDLQHAEEFAKRHKVPRVYGSYQELAQDPDIGELFLHME